MRQEVSERTGALTKLGIRGLIQIYKQKDAESVW